MLNSLFKATPVTGFRGHRVEALPINATLEILARYGALSEEAEAPDGPGGG